MGSTLLTNVTFLDVVAWMAMVFFAVLVIWLFVALFADIFRRDDLSGWAKAAWVFVLFVIPFIGALLYVVFRPPVTSADIRAQEAMRRMQQGSSVDQIDKAQRLYETGSITQDEFVELKRRALA